MDSIVRTPARRPGTGRLGALLMTVAAAIGLAAAPAVAQDWPSRPIRIIVPLAAGGPTDAKARLLAPKLQERLGQPVVVENRPGAAAVIGTELVARAAPDGHTLLMGTPSITINESISKNLPYDRKRDFVPVALVGSGPLVLVVPTTLPPRTIAEFIAHAKANAGKISYASVGNGSISHLTTELFRSRAGIEMTNSPYGGTGPALLAIMSGDVQLAVDAITTAGPQIAGGKMRALAVTTAARSPLLPDVPTVAESGFPGFDIPFWAGLFARSGTPPEILQRLNRETVAILDAPDMREQLARLGTEPGRLDMAGFAKYVEDQAIGYAAAAKAADIKPAE